MALKSLALALALAGCGARGGDAEQPAAVLIDRPPPPPIEERVELRSGHIWVRGRWELHGRRWRWRGGRFEPTRPGFVWIDGHWQLEGERYRWIEGRWRASRERR